MKRILAVVAIAALFFGAVAFFPTVTHAQVAARSRPAAPFCFGTGCDGLYENGGNQNCSVSESIHTSERLFDLSGTYIGTLDIFTSPGTWCGSSWTAVHFNSNVSFDGVGGPHTWCQGNYNTKDQCDLPSTQSCVGCWASGVMDENENCSNGWVTGFDHVINYPQSSFAVKILWGSGC